MRWIWASRLVARLCLRHSLTPRVGLCPSGLLRGRSSPRLMPFAEGDAPFLSLRHVKIKVNYKYIAELRNTYYELPKIRITRYEHKVTTFFPLRQFVATNKALKFFF
jgi:hypothetical protein